MRGSMATDEKSDRRAYPRVPAEMWVEETSGDGRYFRRSGNLSHGGLHLDRAIPLPVGSRVTLSFTLPGDAVPVEVLAEVVSISPGSDLGMGVKFVGVDAAAQGRIDAYLTRASGGG